MIRKYKKGFTLIELLVVVLIIGVLTAVALPMYQGAVDKSRWSTLLPASKAIKDAEEAFKMTNGEYSDTMEHLDVQMNNSDLTFTLNTPNNLADPNVIRITNSKLDNVRLASYLDDSPMFAGQLHCEANDGPGGRGTRLCEKLLGGQELTEQDGYTAYLLDQEITKEICGDAGRSWSTSKTKCYKDTATRCEDLNMPSIAGKDICGYQGSTINYSTTETVNAEGICYSAGSGCQSIIVNEGGTCISNGSFMGCHGAKISGGICVTGPSGGCINAKFSNGSICYANGNGGDPNPNHWHCGGSAADTYDSTSCCCGKFCHSSAPKCDISRCDPYYMDPNNFKNL